MKEKRSPFLSVGTSCYHFEVGKQQLAAHFFSHTQGIPSNVVFSLLQISQKDNNWFFQWLLSRALKLYNNFPYHISEKLGMYNFCAFGHAENKFLRNYG